MKRIVLNLMLVLIGSGLMAQTEGVSINPTGNDPDPSAILDVQSTEQGFLMPRMTTEQRDAIANPVAGLYIYNLDDACFNYYTGSAWVKDCGRSLDADEKSAVSPSSPNSSQTLFVENGPDNSLYLVGSFTDEITLGNTPLTQSGTNLYLARYAPDTDEYLWSSAFVTGTGASSGIEAISVDGAGNLYVAGAVSAGMQVGGTSLSPTGSASGHITKIGPDGTVAWTYQPTGQHVIQVIQATTTGEVFFTVRFEGMVDFGGTSLTPATGADLAVGKLNADGTLAFVNQVEILAEGAAAPPSAFTDLEVDAQGNISLIGNNAGRLAFGTDILEVTQISAFVGEGFLVKLDPTGSFLWEQSFVSPTSTFANQLALDAGGNIFFLLSFNNSVDVAGTLITNAGATAEVIIKEDAAGTLLWNRVMVGGFRAKLMVSTQGDAFWADDFLSQISIPSLSVTATSTGQRDLFVTQFDPAGNQVWSTQSSGSLSETLSDAVYAPNGTLYLVGSFNSNPATFSDLQISPSGPESGFLWPINGQTGGAGITNSLAGSQDNDSDPENEIQRLTIQNDSLFLSHANGVTLSPIQDNLGDHTATINLNTDGNWVSGDGDNEGIFISQEGNVGIGTDNPSKLLTIGTMGAGPTAGPIASFESAPGALLLFPIGGPSNDQLVIGFTPTQNAYPSSLVFPQANLSANTTYTIYYQIGSGNDPNTGSIIYTDSLTFTYQTPAPLSLPISNGPLLTGGSNYYLLLSTPPSIPQFVIVGRDMSPFQTWLSSSNAPFTLVSGFTPLFSLTANPGVGPVIVDSFGRMGIGTTDPQTPIHIVGSMRLEDGTEQNGYVLTSDANGIASWQTPVLNTDEQTLSLNGTQLSISNGNSLTLPPDGDSDPSNEIELPVGGANGQILQTDGSGNYSWVNDSIGGGGTVQGTNGNALNIRAANEGATAGQARGQYSVDLQTFRQDTFQVAIGNYATLSGGALNTAAGTFSTLSGGQENFAIGLSATVGGGNRNAAGANRSTVGGGNNNQALGEASTIPGGENLFARSYGETAIGVFNEDYTPISSTAFEGQDRLFVIGNGTGAFAPSNALTLLKNGNLGLGTTTPDTTLHVIGQIRYEDGNQQNGYVLTSDVNGGATWQPLGKSDFETTGDVTIGSIGSPQPDATNQFQSGSASSISSAGIWQSFTAENTGQLRQVDVLLFGSGSANITEANIYQGEGTSGTLLFTISPGVNTASWETLFSNASIPVIMGAQYTLELKGIGSWIRGLGNPYAGGRANSNPNTDYSFRTFVAIGNATSVISFDENSGSLSLVNNSLNILNNGNVGIGTTTPNTPLHVIGQMRYEDGNQQAGYVLTSDANGTASWQAAAGGGSDNLGNHTATTNVQTSGNWISNDGDNEGLFVAGDGNVGIGTASPTLARVQISGGPTAALGNVGFLPLSGNTGNGPAPATYQYSLYADQRIAALEVFAHSDRRIKNIQGISDAETDLNTLMQIEVTDYRLKDSIAKGTHEIKKVIAQQVAEVYPQAVNTDLTEVVPDIYQRAELQDGWIMLATDLQVGERVKLITAKVSEVYEVTTVEANRFQVSGLASRSPERSEVPLAGSQQSNLASQVFVYGREVKDFHTVDYEALSMLNVSATQEQQRIIEAQQAKIEQMEAERAQSQALLQGLEARLQLLEAKLADLP